MEKRIVLVVVILSCLGIIPEFEFFYRNQILSMFSTSVNIGIRENPVLIGTKNALNLGFYIFLLVAGAAYWFSRFKETRLLRFLFSVLFISKIVDFLIFGSFFLFAEEKILTAYRYHILIGLLVKIAVVFVSWWSLRKLSKTRETEYVETHYDEFVRRSNLEASSWQRFFNLVFDLIVCWLVFSPVFRFLTHVDWFNSLAHRMSALFGDELSLYLIVIAFRLIYYLSFEVFFNASPAKFLSETRVVDEEGNKPSPVTVLKRSLIRFVPFEPWSFFAGRNWHDHWSETEVVREKRQGIKGVYYFMLIPVALILIGAGYFGIAFYDNYLFKKEAMLEFVKKRDRLDTLLKNLTTDDVLKLKPYGGYTETVYLKAEEIRPDAVVFSRVSTSTVTKEQRDDEISNYTLDSHRTFEKFYNAHKDEFERITINRKLLSKGVIREFGLNESNLYDAAPDKEIGISLPDMSSNYVIESIDRYFAPYLTVESNNYSYNSQSKQGEIYFSLYNEGWPADVISVENVEGNVIHKNPYIPFRISNNGSSLFGHIDIETNSYVFRITIKDTINRQQVYEVTLKNKGKRGDIDYETSSERIK